MEAFKEAGLIIDYKVFTLTPKSPDQPNISLWITFKNGAAALDNGVELEEVAKKVIGSTAGLRQICSGRNKCARKEHNGPTISTRRAVTEVWAAVLAWVAEGDSLAHHPRY